MGEKRPKEYIVINIKESENNESLTNIINKKISNLIKRDMDNFNELCYKINNDSIVALFGGTQ